MDSLFLSDSHNESGHETGASVYLSDATELGDPAELPIEMRASIETIVDLSSARALGIRIPHAVLARADRLLEWEDAMKRNVLLTGLCALPGAPAVSRLARTRMPWVGLLTCASGTFAEFEDRVSE